MAFEGDHGLAPYGWADGLAGPQVWTALLKAVAAHQTDPRPYDYITVNEEGTEYLKVWQNGSIVYTTLANTGVPGAATAQGTFPVASHLPSNWMTGTDVNGSSYHVEVYFAAYFNGGDAIHAYPRASYGFPQSNGCVELAYSAAQQLYNSGQDWYGTLVTVS
jgi:lipoprotein-anchoring transpeptidase ErfK/SrfK